MRILFATDNLEVAADLARGYAGVDVVGVIGSLSEALFAIKSMPGRAPIETVVVSGTLKSIVDTEKGVTLKNALRTMRNQPGLRVVVVVPSADMFEEIEAAGAQRFVEYDRNKSAAILAQMLHLAAKTESAKIVTVAGVQGGAGRTEAAKGIAAVLGGKYGKLPNGQSSVMLWELDLKHATLAFDIDSDISVGSDSGRRTISRLLNQDPLHGTEPISSISSAIIPASVSHLEYDVMLAPQGYREVISFYRSTADLNILREQLRHILTIMRHHYRAIVIDVGTDLHADPGPSVALSEANAIVVMATPCPGGDHCIVEMRDIAEDMHWNDRTLFVVNRITKTDGNYLKHMIGGRLSGRDNDVFRIEEGAIGPRTWQSLIAKLPVFG
jgi:cellulose biosynthesis protein BcsQ